MTQGVTRRSHEWSDRALGGLLTVGIGLGVMWALEIFDTVLGGALDSFGIHPHQVGDPQSLLFAPFLHVGFGHLIANSLTFAVLGFVAYVAVSALRFFAVVGITALTSGVGVWFFGTPGSVVIGASGVIFGLLGFLLVRGFFVRSVGAILVSVGVLLLYGGSLTGILPGAPYISWQAHLFGFLGGVVAAWLFRRRRSAGVQSTGRAPV